MAGTVFEQDFLDAIRACGINPPPEIIADGKLHRFNSDTTGTKKNGFYTFFPDEPPSGVFGCHKRDIKEKWCSRSGGESNLTEAEREELKLRMEKARQQREQERIKEQAGAAKTAAFIWGQSSEAQPDYPYLKQKGILGHGTRVTRKSEKYPEQALVVPVWSISGKNKKGELTSLQFIRQDGSKNFLGGGAIASGFFHIGKLTESTVVICEGFATGASIHEATGLLVIVAFNGNNLVNAAQAIRAKYPDAKIILAADDDWKTDGNPGMTHAEQAAETVGGLVAIPRFYGFSRKEKDTDFNDLHKLGGLDAVKKGIELAVSHDQIQNAIVYQEPSASTQTASWPETFFSAPMTDYGNAERLVSMSMGADDQPNLRWCQARDQWMSWDGISWSWDDSGKAELLAKKTLRDLRAAAIANNDLLMEKFALKSESLARLKAMVQLARSESGVPVSIKDLDRDDFLLNCKNGILNLKTGKLKPHSKADLLTKTVEASFVPGATCPRWLKFLAYIMGDDQSKVELLQRAIGASATGAPWQYIIFLYGHGANGKSMFLEVVSRILADYAGEAAQGLLLQKKNEAHPTEVADLMGKRFVTSEEMDQSSVLDEGRVKRLTSARPIKARFMHEDLFEFRPTHKLWFAVNHKPRVRGQDEGIWRRIKLVPFEVQIPPEERRDFEEVASEFMQERDGILGWIVEGCLKWQKDGLGASQAVDSAHEEYRASMDDFGQFLDDCVVVASGANTDVCKVQSSVLYSAYTKWCEENGVRKYMTQTAFSIRMTDRGFQKEKIYQVWWLGITLKSNRDDDSGE